MSIVVWKCKCDDGKISQVSSDSETKSLSCSIGDKPREASKCTFSIISLHITPELAEAVPSHYLELVNSGNASKTIQIPTKIGFTSITEFDRLIDICLTKMVHDEVAEFEIECSKANVKADVALKLLSFENTKELHNFTPDELFEAALELKAQGVNLYTDQRIPDAFQKFGKAVKLLVLIEERNQTDKIVESKQKLMTVLLGNLAGCHVAYKNWEAAIDLCNSVLGNDPQNVKALFRRGVSLIEMQEFQKARHDLLAVKELEPNNTTIKSKLTLLDDTEKAWKHKYASSMKKMFAP